MSRHLNNQVTDDKFKLKSVLVPEGEEGQQQRQKLTDLVTPTFAPERAEAFGQEFSPENIQQISERFQAAQQPRFQRERARLANLLSATGSLQGTPLALSRAELGGRQQAEVSRFEAGLFERSAAERAADRRAAETRQFTLGREEIGREFQAGESRLQREFGLDVINLKREFQLDDREFDETTRKIDVVFGLIEAGQIDKTSNQARDILSQFGITDPESFLSRDEAVFRNWALSQGLSIEEAQEIKRVTGEVFFQDVLENPQRYADIAVDPKEELTQQRINQLLESGIPPENIVEELGKLEDIEAVRTGEKVRFRRNFLQDQPAEGSFEITVTPEEADRLEGIGLGRRV